MTGLPADGWTLAAFAAALPAAALLTGLVLRQLRRRAILDHPNERSSHEVPTPRGGGWGVMLTLLPAWTGFAWNTGELARTAPVLGAAAVLTVVFWLDDLRGLSPALRLLIQAAAVAVGLAALPAEAMIFQGWLPWLPDRLGGALVWLWFVNLFNFMDGIDGIAGAEAAAVGIGLAMVAGLAGLAPPLAWQAAALAGAAAGFLVWNWHPARVFLGDVGSVPLGYLTGWLLLLAAAAGCWAAALLLPLYFLADATLTLLRRLLRGARVWQAHREHFYQKAVQRGRSHAAVVRAILAVDLLLIGLAAWSVPAGWLALPPGAAAVAALLWQLDRRKA